jgi:Kef-type K+ transport system membrane component KefB
LAGRVGDVEGTQTLPLAVVLALVAACSGFTQVIGLHAVIGAFLVGVCFPRDCAPSFIPSLRRAVWPLTMSVLLPIYFLGPGLNFDLGSIASGQVSQLLLIIVIACGAKLLGSAGAARWSGLAWRESAVLGVLLNTRGLVELIILNIGYTEGVIDQTLYSQLVVMALVATFITSPVLRLAIRGAHGPLFRSKEAGQGAALEEGVAG